MEATEARMHARLHDSTTARLHDSSRQAHKFRANFCHMISKHKFRNPSVVVQDCTGGSHAPFREVSYPGHELERR